MAEPSRCCWTWTALAQGHAFFQVSAAEHSPDHALLAYAADDQGSEY